MYVFSLTTFRLLQEWDPNNVLVDLSGRYSLCKHLGINAPVTVKERPGDLSVGGLTADYYGSASDANSVKGYIKQVMPSWLENPAFLDQVGVRNQMKVYRIKGLQLCARKK